MLSGNSEFNASARFVYINALQVPISGIVIDINNMCIWTFPLLLKQINVISFMLEYTSHHADV
jgi:hypothetical protein